MMKCVYYVSLRDIAVIANSERTISGIVRWMDQLLQLPCQPMYRAHKTIERTPGQHQYA